MQLITFPEQTTIIAKDQPPYRPMPAHQGGNGRVTCCWKLTFRERLWVLLGGVIWHQIKTFGNPLQPQLLTVEKPQMLG